MVSRIKQSNIFVAMLVMCSFLQYVSHAFAETKTAEQIQKESWKTNPVAAFVEARRRIARHTAGMPLSLWSLDALEKLPDEIGDISKPLFVRTPNGSKLTSIEPLQRIEGLTALAIQPGLLSEISNLPNIVDLEVQAESDPHGGNKWPSVDIKDITNRHQLIRLVLRKVVPINFDEIGKFSKLNDLSVNQGRWGQMNAKALNVSGLAGLQNLEKVMISANVINTYAFSQTPALKELLIIGRSFKDLSPLSKLSNLETLLLDGSEVYDLKPLENLKSLRYLAISKSPINNIKFLGGLINLESLDLSDTRVANIGALQGLSELKELRLGGTPVKDVKALAGLSKLQKLVLPHDHKIDLSVLDGLIKRGLIIE